jgi:cytidyltransferase-like protein
MKYSTAMVFGVFDGFHPGHAHFLNQAIKRCDKLIVVVTLTEIVQLLKKKTPKYSFKERVDAIAKFNPSLTVIPGDSVLGTWKVFADYTPDIVFLGYDQFGIEKEIQTLKRPYLFLTDYQPDKYRSSLLNKNN